MPESETVTEMDMRDAYDRNVEELTKDPDPTNHKHSLKVLSNEMAGMASRAASEIEQLRNVNTQLAPKAEAYDTIRSILNLMPQASQAYSEDFASRLRRRAAELAEQVANG